MIQVMREWPHDDKPVLNLSRLRHRVDAKRVHPAARAPYCSRLCALTATLRQGGVRRDPPYRPRSLRPDLRNAPPFVDPSAIGKGDESET